MKKKLFIIFVTLSVSIATNVEGQINPGNTEFFPSGGSGDISNSPSIMRMFISLSLVLALILVGFYILKKLRIYKGLNINSRNLVSVIANINLGYKRSVCLLKVVDEILIIGITNNNISLLSKVKTEELENVQNIPIDQRQNDDKNFSSILKKAVQGIRGRL